MKYYLLLLCSLVFSGGAKAETLFTLTDEQNLAVTNVALVLEPQFALPDEQAYTPMPSEVRQRNRQFVPHLSVVQKGANISFPNQDDIKHHVFSFSPAKTFELQLYQGLEHPAEVFDSEGEVELGCNVHDWMLAYVLVVDTPFFGKTDAGGLATLPDMPPGLYRLRVWHPLIDRPGHEQVMDFEVTGQKAYSLTLNLPLTAELDGYEDYIQDESY